MEISLGKYRPQIINWTEKKCKKNGPDRISGNTSNYHDFYYWIEKLFTFNKPQSTRVESISFFPILKADELSIHFLCRIIWIIWKDLSETILKL